MELDFEALGFLRVSLAAIQILVYLGSVMLVVQFGVMLTRKQIQEDA